MIEVEGGVRDLLYVDMADLHAVADHCKAMQKQGFTGSKDMPKLAEFPAPIVEQYINDNGITFAEWMRNPEHVRKMLRDPALAYFRINTMDVGK